MSDLKFTDAFARYGAKLANHQWAFSAFAEDGALVLSCWLHKMSIPSKGILRYTDCISRWKNQKRPGIKIFIAHLSQAFEGKLPVRLVVATSKDPEKIDTDEGGSGVPKTFHTKEDFVGQITAFDGDNYIIDFKKQSVVSDMSK